MLAMVADIAKESDLGETLEVAVIMQFLPEDYRKALHGTAIGLKLAADLNKPLAISAVATAQQ